MNHKYKKIAQINIYINKSAQFNTYLVNAIIIIILNYSCLWSSYIDILKYRYLIFRNIASTI